MNNKKVLVTGITGYIASWVVKYLLDQGFTVHGTVRDKTNEKKLSHFKAMQGTGKGNLVIFEADLLDAGSFKEAMKGCEIVIHMASPFKVMGIKDPQQELINPAVEGARNVLQTVNETESVKRVVFTSSVVAIYGDPIDIKDKNNGVFTEKDWNTTSSLTHQPYSFSKTLAEKEAWKITEAQNRWDLVVINPGFVMGPSLSKRKDSTSIHFMLTLINGQYKTGFPELYFGVVDVRDVAKAHIEAFLKEKASGRHILVNETMNASEIIATIKKHFGNRFEVPQRMLPKWMLYLFGPFQGFSWKYIRTNVDIPFAFDNSWSKKDLGLNYTEISETIRDQVEQLEKDHL